MVLSRPPWVAAFIDPGYCRSEGREAKQIIALLVFRQVRGGTEHSQSSRTNNDPIALSTFSSPLWMGLRDWSKPFKLGSTNGFEYIKVDNELLLELAREKRVKHVLLVLQSRWTLEVLYSETPGWAQGTDLLGLVTEEGELQLYLPGICYPELQVFALMAHTILIDVLPASHDELRSSGQVGVRPLFWSIWCRNLVAMWRTDESETLRHLPRKTVLILAESSSDPLFEPATAPIDIVCAPGKQAARITLRASRTLDRHKSEFGVSDLLHAFCTGIRERRLNRDYVETQRAYVSLLRSQKSRESGLTITQPRHTPQPAGARPMAFPSHQEWFAAIHRQWMTRFSNARDFDQFRREIDAFNLIADVYARMKAAREEYEAALQELEGCEGPCEEKLQATDTLDFC